MQQKNKTLARLAAILPTAAIITAIGTTLPNVSCGGGKKNNTPTIAVPTSVTLDRTTATVRVGNTLTLTATVLPSNAPQLVSWGAENNFTSNIDLILLRGVSSDSLKYTATAMNVGTPTVFAQASNGVNVLTARCVVTVTANNGITAFAEIARGDNYTAGIAEDGTLWAWGDNSEGQLGLGENKPVNVPEAALVGQMTDKWTTVAANGLRTLAVKADGTLWEWGPTANGQRVAVPVQIGTENSWKGIATESDGTFAVRADGSRLIWATGK
ncbi:MAG: Ig-like domain-containing protein [Holophagales bacterium]|jgi:hypothetical protein|nr:Ig-like domain-containing protein [Holophagales bacterium]